MRVKGWRFNGGMPALTRRRSKDASEADFQEWRERDWTARKYAMWEAGERLPSQRPTSIMRCTCGESFDSHRLDESLIHVPHLRSQRSP